MALSILTEIQAIKLDKDNPGNDLASLGTRLRELQQRTGMDEAGSSVIYNMVMLCYDIVADATGNPTMWTATFACEVVDVIVQARASSGSGTATVGKGANAITNAIACVTDTNMARAGTINDAYSTLAIGDTLNVDCNGTTDRGLVTVILKKI